MARRERDTVELADTAEGFDLKLVEGVVRGGMIAGGYARDDGSGRTPIPAGNLTLSLE
jgi:hypothetical protein